MSPGRRYRLLLLAYPASYRSERGEEMVDVLLAGEPRGWRSSTAEALSLLGRGLAERHRRGRPTSAPVGVVGLLLLALLGLQQLVATALRGLGLDGSPSYLRFDVLWVDPRWPVQVVWVLTGLAMLARRPRLVVVSAWTAVVLTGWQLLAVSGAGLPWPGDVGPHWVGTGGLPQASWAVMGLVAALLAGSPSTLAGTGPGRVLRRPRALVLLALLLAVPLLARWP